MAERKSLEDLELKRSSDLLDAKGAPTDPTTA